MGYMHTICGNCGCIYDGEGGEGTGCVNCKTCYCDQCETCCNEKCCVNCFIDVSGATTVIAEPSTTSIIDELLRIHNSLSKLSPSGLSINETGKVDTPRHSDVGRWNYALTVQGVTKIIKNRELLKKTCNVTQNMLQEPMLDWALRCQLHY
jgi:hypothetical protein